MSRYAAFVTLEIDYLICTHSPQSRTKVDKTDVEQWAKTSQWLALDVRNTKTNAAMAEVEFVAWYKLDNKLQYHHELSVFSWEKIDDDLKRYCTKNMCSDNISANSIRSDNTNQILETHAWYYHSAKQTNHNVRLPKRNDKCICGSGKKFKKCCDS